VTSDIWILLDSWVNWHGSGTHSKQN